MLSGHASYLRMIVQPYAVECGAESFSCCDLPLRVRGARAVVQTEVRKAGREKVHFTQLLLSFSFWFSTGLLKILSMILSVLFVVRGGKYSMSALLAEKVRQNRVRGLAVDLQLQSRFTIDCIPANRSSRRRLHHASHCEEGRCGCREIQIS